MAKIKKVEASHLHLNLTAMLDVVFNLIFFFICITNFSSSELPPLEVPEPAHSKAVQIEDRKKIILNVIPEEGGGGRAKAVRFGSDTVLPGQEARVTELLKTEYALNPDIQIDLRVDKSIQFQYVRPVMNAITRAGIRHVNLVAGSEKAQ